MKKITLSLLVFSAAVAHAQLPVSQVAGKKKALIEEFTGIHCGYCPDGHKISDQITSGNPTKVFSVNVHAGSYATPSTGEKDFRTTDGTAILAIPGMLVSGFPAGDVNRAPCTSPQQSGGLAMSRGSWNSAVSTILNQNAYVNIAGEASLNTTTRVLTVNIEAYYTAAGPAANYLTVMVKQDNILGTQSGGSTYYPAMMVGSQYKHNHALRDVITTGSTGEVMGSTAMGYKYTKTLTYTVPATVGNITVALADLDIVAFVSEAGGKNIINVCKVPISTGSTSTNDMSAIFNNVSVYPNPATSNATVDFNISEANNVSVVVSNLVGQTVMTENLGQLNAGQHNYSLDVAGLNSGMYLITITAGESKITKQVNVSK